MVYDCINAEKGKYVPWSKLKHVLLQAEVIFLGQLRHPHLVKLIGYCCEDEERLLVYEFMPRGSLENHLFKSESCLH